MEIFSESPKRKKLRSAPISYERRAEKLQEVKEKDKEEQEESERVAEKIIDNLEQLGIKCPRCSSKNTHEDLTLAKSAIFTHLHCKDCEHRWDELKS